MFTLLVNGLFVILVGYIGWLHLLVILLGYIGWLHWLVVLVGCISWGWGLGVGVRRQSYTEMLNFPFLNKCNFLQNSVPTPAW